MANTKDKAAKSINLGAGREVVTAGVWQGKEWTAYGPSEQTQESIKKNGSERYDEKSIAGVVTEVVAFGTKDCYALKPLYTPEGNLVDEAGILLPDHTALNAKCEKVGAGALVTLEYLGVGKVKGGKYKNKPMHDYSCLVHDS